MSRKWQMVIIGIVVGVILIFGGGTVVANGYFADNPASCGKCHAMESNVQSYLTSNFMDNAHAAGKQSVKCEDCHQQSIMQKAGELISTVKGNYSVSAKDVNTSAACKSCHPNAQIVAAVQVRPDFVANPKLSYHLNSQNAKACRDPRAELVKCQDCHKSHEPGVNYCATCHTSAFGTPG